jgi:Carboxypeptidase regulatory-like domain
MLAFPVILLNLSAKKASAQDDDHGRISGTVTDMTGTTVRGASVTITNEATGVSLPPVTADSSGFYVDDEVAPGTYTEEVAKDQFKTSIVNGIEVRGGWHVTLDLALQLGQKTETVASDLTNPRNPPVRTIRVQNMKIADISPFVSATLSPALNPVQPGTVKVHMAVENISDYKLVYGGVLATFDVRDKNGKLAPETPWGCTLHFFSPCYNSKIDRIGRLRMQNYLKPRKTLEGDMDLTSEYHLSHPGTYTVVCYLFYFDAGRGGGGAGASCPGCLCGESLLPNEGCLEYLRTNKIKVTVR